MATSDTSIQPSTHDSTFRPPNWKQITESVFEVYKPETGGFNLEIVFVHGARTSSSDAAYYRTWMKGDDSGSWLDTWLVERFPRARIISVCYDSNLIKSDTSGHQDMYMIGESLVQCLVQLAGVGQRCPVVLVGHCVGGLVLKHICLWAHKFATREVDCGMPRQSYVNFLKYVKGAFFYSTPNLGSDLPLRTESDEDAPIRRYLEVLHPEPGRSNDDFTKLRRQYGWRTFGLGATNKTRKRKRENIQSSKNEMDDIPTSFLSVEEGSARVDMDEFCSIAGVDHSSICKPSSQESLSFSLLRNFVATFDSLQEELDVELQRSLGLHFSIPNLDHRVDEVIEKLQMEKAEQIHLALVGMDGIGKSTLAKQVLVSIGHQFDYTCFVEFEEVPAREKSRELERLVGESLRYQNGERVRLRDGEKPWNTLRRKKVLIMVDDVESDDQISSLLIPGWCGEGSRLLITSSRQNWTQYFLVYPIPPLAEEAALELFECHVGESVLKSISKVVVSQVLHECEGLPLTLEVIGKHLRGETREGVWVGALKRLKTADSLDGENNSNRVWQKLKVSFENLAEIEKNIFLDIATFDSHGRSAPQYNLKVWKCAWHMKWDEGDIDLGVLNLARRSFLRIHGGLHLQNIMDWQVLSDSSTVGIHKQLRNMGKWISAPANEVPSKWRGLWRLKDVKEMLMSQSKDVSKMEAQLRDKPQTEVLTISMEHKSSYFEKSNFQDAGSVVQWSSIATLEKLRLLKISDMCMTGGESEFRLPTHLTLLDMENCNREWMTIHSEWMWNVIHRIWPIWKVINPVWQIWKVDNHSWPIREEDVERLRSLSAVILNKCNIVQLPENVHRLGRLRILRITTDGMFMMPLPSRFGLLPALEHLYLSAPLESLPSSLWQLSSLQSMVLNGLYIQALPNPITGNHLTALTSLELIDLPNLAELTDSIAGLASLQQLSIEGCSALKNLPEGFGTLHRLERLEISYCLRLETLGDSFCGLRRLQSLGLNNLPQLRALTSLELIDLPNLAELTDSIAGLASLQQLSIEGCSALKNLPEGFGTLHRLERLEISYCLRLETLGDSFCGLRRLQSLGLNNLPQLRALPTRFGYLPFLEIFELYNCAVLKELPESFIELTSIRVVDVLRCGLESLWSNIRHTGVGSGLKKLSRLEICGCPELRSLPSCLGQLSSLTYLNVAGCGKLRYIPESVWHLTSLTELSLEYGVTEMVNLDGSGRSVLPSFGLASGQYDIPTSISGTRQASDGENTSSESFNCKMAVSVPHPIAEFRALKSLRVSNYPRLGWFVQSVGYLTSLTHLGLESCGDLVTIPEAIGGLLSLETFKISDCENLVGLPESIGQLPKLKSLFIQKCGLVNLPESIGQLSCLETLQILKCGNLVNLPESIGQLSCLSEFEIEDNENLVSLPESIGQLSCLETLSILKCGNLVNLPESIGQLSCLSEFEIEDNENLVSLPESIGQLSCLSLLRIEDNENLVNLPESIGQLSCLETLSILKCGNLVNLPESIGQLSCLKTLTIVKCGNLVNLPESIGQLSCLFDLTISYCGLMHLPKSMENLTSLRELYISDCKKLVTVPDFLFQMTSLEHLHVLDSKPFERMIGKSVQLKRLTSLGLSIWNDLSRLFQSLQQICSRIRALVIKCMVCENLKESELPFRGLGGGREELLDRVDDRCGCKHVLPLLKIVENYLLRKNPLKIRLLERFMDVSCFNFETLCQHGIRDTKISVTVLH